MRGDAPPPGGMERAPGRKRAAVTSFRRYAVRPGRYLSVLRGYWLVVSFDRRSGADVALRAREGRGAMASRFFAYNPLAKLSNRVLKP